MTFGRALLTLVAAATAAGAPLCVSAELLTFEDRVAAERAIERFRHSHRVGATESFEEAVPRAVLEARVRRYLKQSVALERFWATPVTAEMLRREVERMVRETQMPERLDELFVALGDDAFLIEECLARRTLVDRLSRSFFAADERIHVSSMEEVKRTWDDWWSEVELALDETSVVEVSLADHRPPALRRLPVREGLTEGSDCPPDDIWRRYLILARERHTAVWTGSEMLVWGGWGSTAEPGLRYDPAIDSWSEMSTENAPDVRWEHTAVWTGTEMIVWGGLDGGTIDTGGRYDPTTDTWTPTSTSGAPAGRHYHTAVWTGSHMIVWGGEQWTPRDWFDSGALYDPQTDTWTPMSTSGAPTPRRNHSAVWTGSHMIVWGGDEGPFVFVNTGAVYDPASDTWTPTSTVNAPSERADHGAVWTGDRMIIWGGDDIPPTGGLYDPVADTWTPTSTEGALGSRSAPLLWTGSLMLVWGYGNSFDNGSRYDPVLDTWDPISSVGEPSRRKFHSAVWTGSHMIVWGGYEVVGTWHEVGTGGRYDPVADVWTPTFEIAPPPTARTDHTAVWTGNQMVVWGGWGDESLDTGALFDPATSTWTPTSTLGTPEARFDHTAVWTGSGMIVWGGYDGENLDTGGRYDPVADTWAPMSVIDSPSARRYHTAIWTGEQMIVWGGSVVTDTGGRYDPETDVWTPTTALNAPTGRVHHTAVWAGDAGMIVWGGLGWGVYLDSGGHYDPATDSWAPTSTAGELPSARSYHGAVWTGEQMIVWGGADGSNPWGHRVNTGGRYSPVTGSWEATSRLGAPPGTGEHGTIWTGEQMVVWGGRYVDAPASGLSTGGRYDPVRDQWTATTTIGVPSGRHGHTTVWTGSQMIVWGGWSSGETDTGGAYLINHDADCDGVSSSQDCAPADPDVFAVPSEVTGLEIADDRATWSWDTAAPGAGSGTTYDLLRGLVGELPVGSGVLESCVAPGTDETSASDDSVPPPASALFYVVRGRNVCGDGPYGYQSDETVRSSSSCP